MPKRTRRSVKKRRGYRKKRYRARPTRSLKLKADYTCKLKSPETTFQNDTIADTRLALQFSLNMTDDFTLFTSIFDQYRILRVIVHFVPVKTTVVNRPYDDTTTPNANGDTPMVAYVIDRDDASTGGDDFVDVRNRQGCVIKKMTTGNKVSFVPNRLRTVYNTPTTSAYVIDTEKFAWLDCANITIPHYGLKLACQTSSPAGAFRMRYWTEYVVQFRSRRH